MPMTDAERRSIFGVIYDVLIRTTQQPRPLQESLLTAYPNTPEWAAAERELAAYEQVVTRAFERTLQQVRDTDTFNNPNIRDQMNQTTGDAPDRTMLHNAVDAVQFILDQNRIHNTRMDRNAVIQNAISSFNDNTLVEPTRPTTAATSAKSPKKRPN